MLFLEHYASKGEAPDGDFTIPFGQANVARQNVTLIAIDGTLPRAVQAADALAGEGIRCEVIDPRTLIPLDAHTLLASVGKTGRAVIAHEAHKRAGPGAEIAALIVEEALNYLDAPIRL